MEPAEYALMDAHEGELWWYRALHSRLVAALHQVQGRVLDAGCGTGGLLRVLALERPDLALIGLERDGSAGHRAAAKSEAPVVRGSINLLPFADQTFDAAIAADVLCHATVDPDAALSQMRRVLRPGGLLVVNMPAYRWLSSAHDRRVHNTRRVSARELRRLLVGAGFIAVEPSYWNGLLLPLMVAQRRLRTRHNSASDVARIPPWLDAIFYAVTRFERSLPVPILAGGSVLATARCAPEERQASGRHADRPC